MVSSKDFLSPMRVRQLRVPQRDASQGVTVDEMTRVPAAEPGANPRGRLRHREPGLPRGRNHRRELRRSREHHLPRLHVADPLPGRSISRSHLGPLLRRDQDRPPDRSQCGSDVGDRSSVGNKFGSRLEFVHRRTHKHSYWTDASCTKIDVYKFILVQLATKPLASVLSRPVPNRVHFIDVEASKVPMHVRNLLSRSLKFIKQEKPDSVAMVARRLDSTFDNLAWAKSLGFSDRPRGIDKLRVKAGLQPPRTAELMHAKDAVLFELAEAYEPADRFAAMPKNRNFSRNDRAALDWLRNATDIKAVDTDNNLGLALTSAAWLEGQLQIHLASYTPISEAEKSDAFERIRMCLRRTVEGAIDTGLIDAGQARYLLSRINSDKVPILRINVKVHKTPVESRPISNLRGFILGPAATFLNELLLPLQKKFCSVCTANTDVIREFEGRTVPSSRHFVTYDITSLYPSLSIQDRATSVLPVLAEVITEHFAGMRWAMGELAIRLLHLVLRDQLITPAGHRGQTYRQTKGITTGLGPASTIANLYLAASFDKHILQSLPGTEKHLRYIDDGIFETGIEYTKEHILNVLNAFDPSIVVKSKDLTLGTAVHILDLDVHLSEARKVYFSTHVKELSIGDYIPYSSAHHPHTTVGTMKAELHRLIVTNTFKEDFWRHSLGFMRKLRRRGLSTGHFLRVFDAVDHDLRSSKLAPRTRHNSSSRTFGFTVKYVKGLELLQWSSVKQLFKSTGCAVAPRFSVGKNLFRTLYRHTWQGG
eukprot:TRINITY_DN12126_c0_g1_i2.p1 TRINITY_DN12126_c0_g1~~TRINITY_DN12126_c0_g1_i2.p1  ORF type:complete len:764 (-),score=96.38 TRINITY_DN12126_c0_g1_i2:1351-3642(-)